MEEGNLVGKFATKLFPEGIHVPEEFRENIKRTKELLKERKPLFEPGFLSETKEGNIYARLDILVPAGRDAWDIIEVKGGTKVKPINIQDVAFQKFVCDKAGLKIRKYSLCHVNNGFVKGGEIKPQDLFTVEDIQGEVDEAYPEVGSKVKGLFEVMGRKECPAVTMEDILNSDKGNVAIDEFYAALPANNVFEMVGWGQKKGAKLYREGIIRIGDVPDDVKLNEKQKIQKTCIAEGKPHFDKPKIREFLDGLRYPLYYLDFETFATVIPIFDRTKPYQAIPFQFSLHIVEKKGDKPKHVSFLADGGKDPRPEFMQALKENLGNDGDIVVYNEVFEKGRIREGIEAFPEFNEWGQEVLGRIKDLIMPFKKFYFYHPKQKGGAGLKEVLPVFSKGANYADLVISDGADASLAYYKSHFRDVPAKEKAKVRDALEKYCELDTLAEIILVEGLRELVRN